MPDRKRITLLIIPHRSRRILKVRLPVFLVKILLCLLSVSLVCITFLIANYARFTNQAIENRLLKGETLRLRDMLSRAEEHMSTLNEDMERLQSLDIKLRSMASISDNERNLAIGPVSSRQGGIARNETGLVVDLRTNGEDRFSLLNSRLGSLTYEAEEREQSFGELVEYFESQRMLLVSVPSLWPVKGWVTSEFGMRDDPYTRIPKMHSGLDIAAPHGTMVFAPSDGVVSFTGVNGGFGKTLIITHGYGITTSYAHLAESFVGVGDRVKRGDKIGSVGDTGRSTGPHLHYEVYLDGIPINPRKFILE